MVKTYIISTHFNRTDFIYLQYETIKRFFKGEYEYIIVNDGKEFGDYSNNGDSTFKDKINKTCQELGIKCIEVPQHLHNERNILFPNTKEMNCQNISGRASISVQYGFNYIVENYKDGLLFILDSDMFLINDLNFNVSINDNIILGHKQQIKEIKDGFYLWNGICVFNLKTNPELDHFSWDCGRVNNNPVDTGGQNYYYLQKYKDNLEIEEIHHTNCNGNINDCKKQISDTKLLSLLNELCNLRNDKKAHKEFFFNEAVIHLRSGGEWDRNRDRNYFNHSIKLLYKYLNIRPDKTNINQDNQPIIIPKQYKKRFGMNFTKK